jgi:two-component sensor histidine kinase
MNLDAAVPCGLILNELVSNCLKHAFPDGRSGEIRIELRKDGGLLASLLVADTGVGLPEDISLWNSKSLGLRLVRILANNMGAAVEVSSRLGTEVKLVFPDTRAATEGSA